MKAGRFLLRGTVLLASLFFFQAVAVAADGQTPTQPVPIRRAVEYGKTATAPLPAETVLMGPENAECKHDYEGAVRYSLKHKTLMVCDGEHWLALQGKLVSE